MTDRKAIVTIEPSGSRREDYRRATAAVRAKFGNPQWQRPDGFVWHHPGEAGVLQLVPEEMHGELPHGGGFAGRPPVPVPRRFESPLPLSGGHPPIAESALARFESTLEIALPAAYRRFLLTSNGGRPRIDAFRAEDGGEETLDVFFGLAPGAKDDLVAMLQRYGERVPAGLLPIARDPFGNLILLDVEDGVVLFWDHELEPTGEEPQQNVRRIAPDFGSWLGSFFPD
jgi:hypothetical protein